MAKKGNLARGIVIIERRSREFEGVLALFRLCTVTQKCTSKCNQPKNAFFKVYMKEIFHRRVYKKEGDATDE